MAEMYQTVILTLSDGRRVVYTGRAQIEDIEDVKVIDVAVTTPKELPRDYHFEATRGKEL